MSLSRSGLATAQLFLAACLAATELPPIGPGPYAVGSTNMEVMAQPPSPMIDYLKGKGAVCLADILAHPASVPVAPLVIPGDPAVYGRNAGTSLPLVLYVLYPTTGENRRESYKFPYPETADNVFPHMQRAGEKPVLARPDERWPLIVYSHGFEGHGLWDLDHLKYLAAHGYIVVSVFHGDGRIGIDSSVNIRPLGLKAALDYLLQHPDFGPVIDPDRIGVSGSSMGGYTILAAMGGRYLKSAVPVADPRIKAGFGLVPFMGATFGFWPFTQDVFPFGKDFSGLRSVRTPFLAVYGEKDESVPAESVQRGTAQMAGPASAVILGGEQHLVSKQSRSDIYTWELLFFNTWLRGDAAARHQLYGSSASVAGGINDQRTWLSAGLPADGKQDGAPKAFGR